jgi:hypothetical protein
MATSPSHPSGSGNDVIFPLIFQSKRRPSKPAFFYVYKFELVNFSFRADMEKIECGIDSKP